MTRNRMLALLAATALVVIVVKREAEVDPPSTTSNRFQRTRWNLGPKIAVDLGGSSPVDIHIEPAPPPEPLPEWSQRLANMPASIPPPSPLPALQVEVPREAIPDRK